MPKNPDLDSLKESPDQYVVNKNKIAKGFRQTDKLTFYYFVFEL